MIVELEMENKKLKQSKTILESRIKLFEEERQRQAQDHLSQNPQLPSTSSNHFRQYQGSSLHQCNCCQCRKQSSPVQVDEELTRAIINLDVKMDVLTQELKRLASVTATNVTTAAQAHIPSQEPRQDDIVTIHPDDYMSCNSSLNTIDEDISDSELGGSLNYFALTNQPGSLALL